jgi:FAD-linked oxidoreductase
MRWSNWSGSVTCEPVEIHHPSSQEEIIALVKTCRAQGKKLRPVGSGHSFTPVAQTDDVMVSLDNYQGIEQIDREKHQAVVKAGTTIHNLGKLLFEAGLAQINLGDIDHQSIAGAISTGTHGSGAELGTIATQVIALTLITAEGEVLECSPTQEPDIFKAAQISLGALGIISKVTLQLVPAYALDYEWRKMPLNESLENIEQYKRENRNFEFYWLPYTERILGKFMNMTDKTPHAKGAFRRFNETVIENGALFLLSEVARLRPSTSQRMCKTLEALATSGHDITYSHQMYATERWVKFQEMEYSIPAEHFVTVLQTIKQTISEQHFAVNFPLECRFVKGDDIDLSPAYGRDSAYIAVHMYKGMAYKSYFEAIEAIFRQYDGRPHWGKMHTLKREDFETLYPRWEHFQGVRQQLDPSGIFLNSYLERVLC